MMGIVLQKHSKSCKIYQPYVDKPSSIFSTSLKLHDQKFSNCMVKKIYMLNTVECTLRAMLFKRRNLMMINELFDGA